MDWLVDFTKSVDMVIVNRAKKLIRKFPDIIKTDNIIKGTFAENNYTISDVEVMRFTEKDKKNKKGSYEDRGAVFFRRDGLVQLGLSFYPFRFSIPKSNLLDHETEEEFYPQTITVTEWAYENCYMMSYNRIYENWGKMMKILFKIYETAEWNIMPCYVRNPYRNIIKEIKTSLMAEKLKEYNEKPKKKKIKEEKIMKEKKDDFKAKWIFYTDGSGNLSKGQKIKSNGHYNVFLLQTKERWKTKNDMVTSNQAELKGVLAAIFISIKRKYDNVLINTDSQNVLNWVTGNEKDGYVWEAKSENIIPYVEKLRELLRKNPNIKLNKIPRVKNYAHGF